MAPASHPRLRFRIASDGLQARVAVSAGSSADIAEVQAALTAAGVVHGIDDDACALLGVRLRDPTFTAEDVLIATGTPPGDGRPFDFTFQLSTAGSFRDDGTFDFLERESVTAVTEGEILARRRPDLGRAGRRVDGIEITAPALQRAPVLGEGVIEDSEGTVRAVRAGVVIHQAGKLLDVVRHVEQRGNVDLRSGNLAVDGSLTVHGDVCRGYVVRATEDVLIKGGVAGTVLSDGSVTIKAGVIGGEPLGLGETPPDHVADGHGRVHAGSRLCVQHCHQAKLAASDSVEVVKDAVASKLSAATIKVGGRMIGGEIEAETSVQIRECGNTSGTPTSIRAGAPIQRHERMVKDLIASAKIRRQGRPKQAIVRGRAKTGKVARQERMIADMMTDKAVERRRRTEELRRIATVELALAHPGVTVYLGESMVRIDRTFAKALVRIDPQTNGIVLEKAS